MTEHRPYGPRRSVLYVILISLVITAILIALTGTRPAQATVVNSPTILTMPEEYGGTVQAYRMIATTARLIHDAPRGSTVRHLGYLLNTPEPINEMIAAHRRGVNVKVTLDRHAKTADSEHLASVLGRDRSGRSFVYYTRSSGFHPAGSGNFMHGKLTQVSTSGTRRFVSVVSSANLAYTNSLKSSNATEVYDDRTMYAGFHKFFDAVTADRNNGSYYRRTTSGQVTAYMGPGQPQVVYGALGKVRSCSGVRIDVAQFQWSDADTQRRIASRLWGLASRGCQVRVAINYDPHRVLIGSRTAAILLKKKNGHRIIQIRNVRIPGKIYIHNKELLLKKPSGTVVYGGSKNFNGNRNADILTRNTSGSVYAAYLAQFGKLWALGTPVTSVPQYGPGIAAAGDQEWDEAE